MDSQRTTRVGIVGGGPRASFFMRQATMMRDRIEVVAMTSRSAETREKALREYGVPTVESIDQVIRARPDFVLVALRRDGVLPATLQLVDAGTRVLVETPPAIDAAGLRELWDRAGDSGLVQVAEQSMFMPSHSAKLSAVRSGVIGKSTAVQVSSNHGYHAIAIMRAFLGAGFGPVEVSARSFTAPVATPVVFDTWQEDLQPADRTTTVATLDFGDGRMGLYDFTDLQWFNPFRHRRLVVRGATGEIDGDSALRLRDGSIVRSTFERRQLGIDMNHEGFDLDNISFDGRVVFANPYRGGRRSDEDIAASALLDASAAWARDEGPEPYSLAEASQDHLLGLAIDESVATGLPVTTEVERWARGLGTSARKASHA